MRMHGVHGSVAVGLGLVLAAGLVGGCASRPIDPPTAVSTQISKAYGCDSWRSVRLLAFDLVVRQDGQEKARFRHLWDRSTDQYRYEADTASFAGASFLGDDRAWGAIEMELPPGRLVALVNRKTGKGQVYINGQPIGDEGVMLRRVLERINNDTFMLTLPLELYRGGTQGKTYSVRRDDGTEAEVYRYHYPEGTGATPGDLWALFYDLKTLRIYQSRVKMQNTSTVATADWNRHQVVNGVTFNLEWAMGDKILTFDAITMSRNAPPGAFTDPRVVISR